MVIRSFSLLTTQFSSVAVDNSHYTHGSISKHLCSDIAAYVPSNTACCSCSLELLLFLLLHAL